MSGSSQPQGFDLSALDGVKGRSHGKWREIRRDIRNDEENSRLATTQWTGVSDMTTSAAVTRLLGQGIEMSKFEVHVIVSDRDSHIVKGN